MEYLTVEDVMMIHQAETGHADPSLHLKAAALMHSLARNHPFVDGNKRTAAIAALTFCFINGQMIVMDDSELVALTLDVAEGQLDVPTIAKRLEDRSVEIE